MAAHGHRRWGSCEIRPVDHRRSAATIICDVDLIGHRVHRQRPGMAAHGHRCGSVGRPVDHRHSAAAVIYDVDFIGHRVHRYRIGQVAHGHGCGYVVRPIDHRHTAAVPICDVDFVGHRVHRYCIGTAAHGIGSHRALRRRRRAEMNANQKHQDRNGVNQPGRIAVDACKTLKTRGTAGAQNALHGGYSWKECGNTVALDALHNTG